MKAEESMYNRMKICMKCTKWQRDFSELQNPGQNNLWDPQMGSGVNKASTLIRLRRRWDKFACQI